MVIWTFHARKDLRQIYDFIATDSVHYAKKVTDEIQAKPSILDEFPRAGKIVHEVNEENLRELSAYSYRIIYEMRDNKLYVLTVAHKRRDIKADELETIRGSY